MAKRLLWLDDARDPFDKEIDWVVFSPIGRNVDIAWVVSYKEFTEYIQTHGLPDGICFDHDLGDIVEKKSRSKGMSKKISRQLKQMEKTGYDCAKWLVSFCLDNNKQIPPYNIQSANPVGKENIDKLLKSFIKFRENED